MDKSLKIFVGICMIIFLEFAIVGYIAYNRIETKQHISDLQQNLSIQIGLSCRFGEKDFDEWYKKDEP